MTINDLKKGDRVSFVGNEKKVIQGTFSYVDSTERLIIDGDDDKYYRKPIENINLLSPRKDVNLFNETKTEKPKVVQKVPQKKETFTSEKMQKFDVNQRFSFMESYVRMVANGFRNSLIITGEGGLGKTYTVEETLSKLGLTAYDEETGEGDYYVVSGCSTAKGLYDTLCEHRDKLLVFDDCDDVLLIKKIRDIFKGALDSKDKRIVSWVVSDRAKSKGDANRFEFTGRIIFISNINYEAIDKPLLTRSTFMNLVLSIDEKIDRMRFIAGGEGYRPLVSAESKEEALNIIEENKHSKKLSMRTLLEAFDFIEAGEENWRDLLVYSMS